jgi:hypothetical protein
MGGCRIYYHHYKHKLKILLRFFLAIFSIFSEREERKNGGTNKKFKSFF